jgi:hypothetical protein
MPFYANRPFTCNGTDYVPGQVMKYVDVNALSILESMVDSGAIVTDEDLRAKGWLEHRARVADVHLERFKVEFPDTFKQPEPRKPIPVAKKAAPAKKTAPSKAE